MRRLFKGGTVYMDGALHVLDVLIDGERITRVGCDIPLNSGDQVINCTNKFVVPGFVDVHVHLREPGFSYKETIASGTCAGARAGYTHVCAMPNLNPAPDSLPHLTEQLSIIERDAVIHVTPVGAITEGQRGAGALADIEAIAEHVAGFSDDGRGIQSDALMEAAMRRVKAVGSRIIAHCEVDALLHGGYIHAGGYAQQNGHVGISSESEWRQIERDIRLVEKTGCPYHVCHISTKEAVSLIRRAKSDGLPITCETAPHYLLLSDDALCDDGRFKMNPPIRGSADRDALVAGICDGTIDVIATDHAPHAVHEKDKGLRGSLMGVVGLETAFPMLNERLVSRGIMTLERLLALMCDHPRRLFGLRGGIAEGGIADIAVLDTDCRYRINSNTFLSMGRATPFDGEWARGENTMTVMNGEIIWQI